MSSDSSVTVSTGSKVRQFGLYRTIDAKTEDFLRLSKKRQIRQGCACAAVSTAITVTIVVSMLLLYEYCINPNSKSNNKYVTKPSWLNWINDSADLAPFDEKYSKIKLNFDKTTLRLLPMLLNALNRNMYLDQIINDYASSSPTYDGRDTTEFTYKKDTFHDIRNWYKMPRLYAVEYKTSPVVYYRSPAKSVEYFTKTRKIREYQRVLNYFDKMIADKVGFVPTVKMPIEEMYKTERSQKKLFTIPVKKFKGANGLQRSVPSNKIMNQKNGCKCPKKLGELLTKLISSISYLMPYAKLPITKCKEKPLDRRTIPLKKINVVVKNSTTNAPKIFVHRKPLYSATPAQNIKISSHITHKNSKINDNALNLPLHKGILKPINKKISSADNTPLFRNQNTTVKENIKATATAENTIKPLNIIVRNLHDYQSVNQNIASENIDGFKNTSTEKNKFQASVTAFDEDEYEDYFGTTPTNSVDVFDIHDLGYIKTKMITPIIRDQSVTKKIQESPKSKYKDIENNAKSSKLSKEKGFFFDNKSNEENVYDKLFTKFELSRLLPPKTTLENSLPTIIDDNIVVNDKTQVPTNTPTEVYLVDQLINQDNTIADDKILQDQLQETDNSNYSINYYSHTLNKTNLLETHVSTKNMTDDKFDYKQVEEIAKTRKYNSKLPQDRPIYSEIQRNEWRQNDNQDFDMNFNNNLFDLTNL